MVRHGVSEVWERFQDEMKQLEEFSVRDAGDEMG